MNTEAPTAAQIHHTHRRAIRATAPKGGKVGAGWAEHVKGCGACATVEAAKA